MSTSASSKAWLARQRRDEYVKKAALSGLRARSAFKLMEIHEKHRLIRRGDVVIDLGGAPGGWAQVAVELVGCESLPPAPPLVVPSLSVPLENDGAQQEQVQQALDGSKQPRPTRPQPLEKPWPVEERRQESALLPATIASSDKPGQAAGSASRPAARRKSVLTLARDEVLQLSEKRDHNVSGSLGDAAPANPLRPAHRRSYASSAAINDVAYSPVQTANARSSTGHRGTFGLVLSVDLLPIAPMPGCRVLQGDFTSAAMHAAIRGVMRQEAGARAADVILSDMAHKFAGDASVDHVRQMQLAWTALVFADQVRSLL